VRLSTYLCLGTNLLLRLFYLVPELCILCGITDDMRNDFRVMKDLGDVTRVKPQQRQEAILKFIKRIKATPEAYAHLQEWNLDVSPGPEPATVTLQGRILPATK